MNVEESETIMKDKLNDDIKNKKYKGEHDGHLPMFKYLSSDWREV